MSNLIPLIANENMKIYRRPRTWIMAGILVALNILIAVVMSTQSDIFTAGHFLDYVSTGITALGSLAVIFTVVVASDAVASEFTWGTIKLLLIRPAKRWKILLAKLISSFLFGVLAIILILAVSAVLGLIFFGTENASDFSFTDFARELGYLAVNLLITVAFAFMISSVFRGSALAIALSLVILFLGEVFTAIILQSLRYSWAKYLLFLNMDLSIYEPGGDMFFKPLPGMSLGFSLTVLAVYFVVFLIVSFAVFTKRDVSF